MTQFSARIKAIRKERKLTQKQMAELLSTTERNYQYYEAGAREPNLETLVDIAHELGVSADYLVGLSDYPVSVALDKKGNPYIPKKICIAEERT